MAKRILSVKVEWKHDESPDYSHLGEYSNHEGPDSIDRKERGDMGRHEYRYFIPGMTAEQTGNPESPEQDYQRMVLSGVLCRCIGRYGQWRDSADSIGRIVGN